MSSPILLVTGGASGIGRATAEAWVASGGRVVLADRSVEAVQQHAKRLGESAYGVACDVSCESEVARAVETCIDQFGAIDALVTSAGVNQEPDRVPIQDLELDAFQQILDINLVGTFLAVKHALPHLLSRRGAIVLVSSTAGIAGHGQGWGYTASKGGVVALTRMLALQYGPQGVRTNCVCPGATASEGMGAFFQAPEGAALAGSMVPLGRPATPEEIAASIVHLAGAQASYVNGQVLAVDGGATVR